MPVHVGIQEVRDMRVGDKTIVAAYCGAAKVWPSAFLIVEPEYVWLTEGNDFSADFDVISNVDWIVEGGGSDADTLYELSNSTILDNGTLIGNGTIEVMTLLANAYEIDNRSLLKNNI